MKKRQHTATHLKVVSQFSNREEPELKEYEEFLTDAICYALNVNDIPSPKLRDNLWELLHTKAKLAKYQKDAYIDALLTHCLHFNTMIIIIRRTLINKLSHNILVSEQELNKLLEEYNDTLRRVGVYDDPISDKMIKNYELIHPISKRIETLEIHAMYFYIQYCLLIDSILFLIKDKRSNILFLKDCEEINDILKAYLEGASTQVLNSVERIKDLL